jgi:hypothetical protein
MMFRRAGTSNPILALPGGVAECSFPPRPFRARRAAIATIRCVCLVAIAAVGSVGCRPGYQNVSPVTGRVTLDGVPLSEAQVMFLPTTGRPSTGETNAEGVYELVYTFKQKGAERGMHTVRVTTAHMRQDYTVGKERVPKIYNEHSTLQKEVGQGRNTIDLDLVSSPGSTGSADPGKKK